MNVIIILACLFAALFVIVTITERYGKPLTAEQQSKYNKIIPILFFVMIVAAIIKMV